MKNGKTAQRKVERAIRRESDSVKIERLEERIALSLLFPKKAPEPPPYPPGTRYSLASRETVSDQNGDERLQQPRPEVERLEERVALSLMVPKKTPEPPPYPPGTRYGVAKRENMHDLATAQDSKAPKKKDRPEVEQLEERVALSLIVPKKAPEPPPYPPGADYSLAKRANLAW